MPGSEEFPKPRHRSARDTDAWIENHEQVCGERYERILEELAKVRSEIKQSRRVLNRRMETGDTVLATRLDRQDKRVEKAEEQVAAALGFQQDVKVKMAYAAGAMGVLAFIGSILGPVVSNWIMQ